MQYVAFILKYAFFFFENPFFNKWLLWQQPVFSPIETFSEFHIGGNHL